MSYDQLLRQTVTIERPTALQSGGSDILDEYGQPERRYVEVATSKALVQPKPASRSGREVPLVSEAGPVVSDHTIFLPATTDVRESDRVLLGDRIYEVKLRKNAGGQDHHVELDAQLLTGVPLDPGDDIS